MSRTPGPWRLKACACGPTCNQYFAGPVRCDGRYEEADALHCILSDGTAWTFRYDRDLACSLRVFRCHWEFEEECAWESTRLSFATLDGLRDELRQKFAEDMEGVVHE